MNSFADAALDQAVDGLREVLSGDVLAGLSDEDRAGVLSRLGEIGRLTDAVTAEAVACANPDFGYRFGCAGVNELLQRALLTDAASAGKTIRVAAAVRRDISLSSGDRLPAKWPLLREVLMDGVISVAGFLAAIGPLEAIQDRLRPEDRLAADEVLAGFARGYRDAGGDDADAGDGTDVGGTGSDAAGEAHEGPAGAGDGADAGEAANGSAGGDADDAAGASLSTDGGLDGETTQDGGECGGDGDAAGSGAGRARGPAATPGELRNAAQYLAAVLDPDGAEPKDRDASSRRFVRIGAAKNGLHPITGNLLPEVAAQLQLIFDAYNNPKVGGAPVPAGVHFTPSGDGDGDGDGADVSACNGATGDPHSCGGPSCNGAACDSGAACGQGDPEDMVPDPARMESRDAGMKRHDALAAALGIAARHDEMPKLGGGSPTLVVHVNVNDLAAGTGWARIPGAPGTDNGSLAHVPVSVAAHTACTGAIQRVLMDEGRIVGISVTDRIFTVHQRRAIILRDKECLIPGCHVPASWCEIHHVTEHARGGATHTDNGVPLCWWHHRSLDTSGWEIRMNTGVPEIRGPAWWDPTRRWRTPRPLLKPAPAARTG